MPTSTRAALVTGASSGIGLAIARLLVAEGHALTLVARGKERLERAAADLGPATHPVVADVAREEEVARVVREHVARLGRLDVLVNSAGTGTAASLRRLDAHDLDAQLDVNLRAVVLLYRECLHLLRTAGAEHGKALVVNVSSIFGKRGGAGVSVYSATKAGVVAFTQSMNAELLASGIKSTALCPALVDTPMVAGVVDASRMIRPEDVAEAVRYLLRTSPQCVVPEVVFISPGDLLWPERV